MNNIVEQEIYLSVNDAISEYCKSGYFIFDKINIDFNKNVKYVLVVMELSQNKNSSTHCNLPIILLRMIDAQFIKEGVIYSFENRNSPAPGFIGNNFNKEHNCFVVSDSFYADNCFVASFLTFRYDQDRTKIVLDNIKLDYINREDPDKLIPSKHIDVGGEIIFGDITEQLLIQLMQNK